MKKIVSVIIVVLILVSALSVVSCVKEGGMFTLTSSELVAQGIIPDKYTLALGKNISPPLSWSNIPEGTKSFALTIIDPDVPWGRYQNPPAGFLPGDLFIHWVIYDIPAEVTSISEGISPEGTLPEGAKELNNSCLEEFGPESPYYQYRSGYIGMAPPAGDIAHAYVFTLYALNTETLGLSPEVRYPDFIDAIKGKVLARSSFIAYFGVKKK